MLAELGADAGAALAYSAVGIVLMAVGFGLVDLLTPGDLRAQIWIERNRNAAILLASNLFGTGIIVATAIWTSDGEILKALLASAVYGVIGLAAMALAFVLLDALTPGDFRTVVADPEPHPAVWVTASAHVAVALVVAAGLT
ncbi:DUF350 domain-containing protein [Nocardia caishijiensis]|uniref:Uncharacterized protein DUF350 n=1 Tax=Nocardia caishijiensis TaxID=184756 RepID=A0ABQ6YGR4_9NOCA|nr:DUF350 domain-containing protein [Nocardia caishijiensis]KAF0844896.1 uncharacterized protein DUF350 [Nocardia caishijiensis]